MPLDPNIILQGQAPQIQNPIDVQNKVLTMKHLAMQGQLENQAFQDDQNMRSAYKNNVTVGPDGKPVLNQAGVLSDLSRTNPMQSIQANKEFAAQDLAMKEQKMKMLSDTVNSGKMLVAQIPLGANIPPEQKQSAWTNMLQQGAQLGMPNHDSLPQQYPGDDFVKNMSMHLMTAEEQLKQQNSDRDYQIKSQHEKTYEQDVGVRRAAQATNKENQAIQQTTQMLMSGRGDAAYQQANKDYYNVQKANTLANLYGDPNKLSSQQVNLLVSELGKIATGGVPSMHELDGLTPSTLTGKLSAEYSKLVNDPTPARAGAFVKQYQSYANAIGDDAKKFMIDRDKRVLDSQSDRLGQKTYEKLSNIHLKRFDQAPQSAAHPQDSQAVQWAKSNPTDPRAAQILQLNGSGQ